MALGILSGGSVQQLRNLIESEDVRGLIKLPKVGKKIAEQMILSLKGKLPNLEQSPTPAQQKENEILSALMNLGFSEDLAQQISDEIPSTYNFEEGMRWALQKLSVHRQKLNQRGV